MKYLVLMAVFLNIQASANPYSNNNIHKWATSVVFKTFPNEKSGVYDICLGHSLQIKTKGKIFDPHSNYTAPGPDDGLMPIGLAIDGDGTKENQDIVNACALILIGGEW